MTSEQLMSEINELTAAIPDDVQKIAKSKQLADREIETLLSMRDIFSTCHKNLCKLLEDKK